MKIDIATPAMLFPAISLLLLAYTNRFLTLATIIRNFSKEEADDNTQAQIKNLRLRIQLIKRMQIAGVGSFFLCVVSMLAIYLTYQQVGNWVFAASLVSLLYSFLFLRRLASSNPLCVSVCLFVCVCVCVTLKIFVHL